MIHAQGVANGQDFIWVNVGEPSQEILTEFKRLAEINVEDLI